MPRTSDVRRHALLTLAGLGALLVVQPMPAVLVVKQIVFDGITVVILGMLVAFLHGPPARA